MTCRLNKRAELEKKRAELADAIRELYQQRVTIAGFERDLQRALNWPSDRPVKRGQKPKLNREGRPTKYNRAQPTWKGWRGYEFVAGILKIRERDKCSVAAAIRQLKRDDPDKWSEEERDLQRRFQEIKDYWRPWCRMEMILEAEAATLLAKTESLAKAKP
jgi:hypothetical protein